MKDIGCQIINCSSCVYFQEEQDELPDYCYWKEHSEIKDEEKTS